jgi:RHS repeat-associated protein
VRPEMRDEIIENGALKTLGGIPGYSSFTFGIDGKGRPTSAAFGSTNLIGQPGVTNGVTYNPMDEPLVTSFISGDTDTYTYDPNTGRMLSYSFAIGSPATTLSGGLTWNPNGTLRQLAITDGFNSSNTQTCNYGTSSVAGYDELGRLVSANCGSTWAQTFSFDPFNNLSKSGSISWNPGYNQANNHYQNGSTYDSNGNLLTDTFHTYTWNQDNKPSGVTDQGTTVTYDALGRMVENKTGSTYTQTLYSPIGRVGLTNGQTTARFLVPMPGGSMYESDNFWHTDWLGSVRLVSWRGRTMVADRSYAPFGEIYNQTGSSYYGTDFTGDLQDTIAGTFDTPNRELNPNQGRWLTPDPAHSGWNAYGYSTNPLGETDPSGFEERGCDTGICTVPDTAPQGPDSFGSKTTGNDPGRFGWNGSTPPWYNSALLQWYNTPPVQLWGAQNPISIATKQIITDDPCGTNPNCVTVYATPDEVSPESMPTATIGGANNGNWFQRGLNYLKTHPVFISVNEILAAQITYQASTGTICANVGAGASVPPTKAVTVGVLNEGNMGNWTNVQSSWGYSFGANLFLGYQASTNSSGTIGGPTVSGVGLSGSYTYGGCTTVP